MNIAKRWIETWSALEWPEALEADQELVLDLLDCLVREVAPLALESSGMLERGRQFRSLGSLRSAGALADFQCVSQGAMDEGRRLDNLPSFLAPLGEALETPSKECLAIGGPAWRAVAQAIDFGAPDFGVRACLGRIVERRRGSELRPQAALPW